MILYIEGAVLVSVCLLISILSPPDLKRDHILTKAFLIILLWINITFSSIGFK